jgi:hypothetical protein
MNAIRMQTLVDSVCDGHEGLHSVVTDGDVSGCESLLLVQPPDVQLVNGENAGDLG